MNNRKILLIDCDETMQRQLRTTLEGDGFELELAGDGKTGYELAHSYEPDLIITEIVLPEFDGFELIRRLRGDAMRMPIIVHTSRNDEIDKVVGLELGANDYVIKPCGLRELSARVKAQLRDRNEPALQRSGRIFEGGSQLTDVDMPRHIEISDLSIDTDSHEVRVAGEAIPMTLKEYELLKLLSGNRGRLFTRAQILDKIWGYEYEGETRTIDVHIRHLRKKLENCKDFRIDTIRGLGYKVP